MRVHTRLQSDPSRDALDGMRRVNRYVHSILAEHTELVPLEDAELVVLGGLPIPKQVEVPCLVFTHSQLTDLGDWRDFVPSLRRCDTLIINSRSDERVVTMLGGTGFCRKEFLPLFADTELFRPLGVPKTQLREELGIPTTGKILLSVNRLFPAKNVHAAFDLLAVVQREISDIHMVVVGTGPSSYHIDLEAYAKQLGVSVIFIDGLHATELNRLYNASDALVHLSLWRENFGLVPVEAQAAGLPVLVGKWAGLADTVLHNVTGYYADSSIQKAGPRIAWQQLVDPCVRLCRHPPLQYAMGRMARQHVLRNYGAKLFKTRLISILDQWEKPGPKEMHPVVVPPLPDSIRAVHELLI